MADFKDRRDGSTKVLSDGRTVLSTFNPYGGKSKGGKLVADVTKEGKNSWSATSVKTGEIKTGGSRKAAVRKALKVGNNPSNPTSKNSPKPNASKKGR